MMRIDIFSIFPEFFDVLDLSLMGKARRAGVLDVRAHDLRNWATGRHASVDDSPYGGGAGMVMRADVWLDAVSSVLDGPCLLMVPSPSGRRLTQAWAQELAASDRLAFACGRYEGIDARFLQLAAQLPGVEVQEFSLGDYVLNGGESATLVALEAVGRLVPGVVGNSDSLVEESHGDDGLLEYPVFTRPESVGGLSVPSVLLTGDHALVDRWRHERALDKTMRVRPDLLREGGKAYDRLSAQDAAYCVLHGFWPWGVLPEVSIGNASVCIDKMSWDFELDNRALVFSRVAADASVKQSALDFLALEAAVSQVVGSGRTLSVVCSEGDLASSLRSAGVPLASGKKRRSVSGAARRFSASGIFDLEQTMLLLQQRSFVSELGV